MSKFFCLSLLALTSFSCSQLRRSSEPTPEVKAAVIGVCADYLRLIVLGRYQQVQGLILWSDFVGTPSETGISRESVEKQIADFQNRWPLEEHPLLGLRVLKVEVNGNKATVELQKQIKEPVIRIDLFWSGSGWLVRHDNLFGASGEIAKLIETTKSHSPSTNSNNS